MSSPIDSAKPKRAPSNPQETSKDIPLGEMEEAWANNIRALRRGKPPKLRPELAELVAAHRKAANEGNG